MNLPDRLRARGEEAIRTRANGDRRTGCRILQDLPALGVGRGLALLDRPGGFPARRHGVGPCRDPARRSARP